MERLGNNNLTKSNKSDDHEEVQEKQHFQRIVNAFKYYRIHALRRVLEAEKSYEDLPPKHRDLLPTYKEHLKHMRTCIDHNYQIIRLIIQNTDHMFENRNHTPDDNLDTKPATEFDMDKIRSTLKQIVRDWSSTGEPERKACYQPVIQEIMDRFPRDRWYAADVSVLVPGAGLGRLAFEIARLGYTCQGNEFSLFMLFVSNFILNRCKDENMFVLYPWVHQYCNVKKSSDQIRSVEFPDVNPSELPPNSHFSMAAGDFLDVYTEPNVWNCVCTVFFIDTAHNIIEYIETIHKILKPGGIWINLGPLLYHFADMPNEKSIELTYEDVKDVIKKLNFTMLKEIVDLPATYTQNTHSMLKYQYDSVFFVCQKSQTQDMVVPL